jgi:hypothetical protein
MKDKDISVAQFMKICAAQAEGLIEWEAEEVWECLCKGKMTQQQLAKTRFRTSDVGGTLQGGRTGKCYVQHRGRRERLP